jgi:hypothetical protein
MTQTIEQQSEALALKAFDALFVPRLRPAQRTHPAGPGWSIQPDQERFRDVATFVPDLDA